MKKTDKKETNVKEKRPECEKCHSKLVYIRIKDKELVCRSCGHIQKLKDSDDKNKK